ncbi:hypothetical protein KQI58_15530 [Enterococcus raffinosus]|uniref:hypothetical protein n=1 Tax=Enterococcus raffinosus TaxID=71452 RepID=UPI001C0FF04B|nr:hypothetical protein [Enterococcus raffinosus]MBU5362486.1 hypothetical protein [Enterococcus raffinosus]
MSEFKEVFDSAQQFLILQAYIDSQLSEEELMNFTLVEATDETPVVFYQKGVMIIHPKFDLDQFTHDFFPHEKIVLQSENKQVIVELPNQELQIRFETVEETKQFAKDIRYLFAL